MIDILLKKFAGYLRKKGSLMKFTLLSFIRDALPVRSTLEPEDSGQRSSAATTCSPYALFCGDSLLFPHGRLRC